MLRRLIILLAVVASGLIAATSASAAPTKGQNTETLVFECADATVRVILKPDNGASGWDVDAQRELTGVRYFSTALDGRVYLGDLTTEPTDVDPLFTTAKEWGNRTGHEDTVSCSAKETFATEDGQTLTGFFDFTATQQDKGN